MASLAHPAGAWLVCWATAPLLPLALETVQRWGFTYSTAGAWAKQSRTGRAWAFGTGHVLRSAAEFWIVARIGHHPPPLTSRAERNLLVEPVGEHSQKPEAFRALLQRLFPGPRLELFARVTHRPGWHLWGDQVGLLP